MEGTSHMESTSKTEKQEQKFVVTQSENYHVEATGKMLDPLRGSVQRMARNYKK